MKETYSQSWMIQLVFAFMLLFISFLCLMINYGKSIKVKNQTISIIEKYNGITDTSKTIVNNYLDNTSYKGRGKCPKDYKQMSSSNGNWCIKAVIYNNNKIRYKIITFYDFLIPAFGNILTFNITGQTIDLKYKKETAFSLKPAGSILEPNYIEIIEK